MVFQVVDLSYSAYVEYIHQYVQKLTKYLRNTVRVPRSKVLWRLVTEVTPCWRSNLQKRPERLELFQSNIQEFIRRIIWCEKNVPRLADACAS